MSHSRKEPHSCRPDSRAHRLIFYKAQHETHNPLISLFTANKINLCYNAKCKDISPVCVRYVIFHSALFAFPYNCRMLSTSICVENLSTQIQLKEAQTGRGMTSRGKNAVKQRNSRQVRNKQSNSTEHHPERTNIAPQNKERITSGAHAPRIWQTPRYLSDPALLSVDLFRQGAVRIIAVTQSAGLAISPPSKTHTKKQAHRCQTIRKK